jgi:hypothetical protein
MRARVEVEAAGRGFESKWKLRRDKLKCDGEQWRCASVNWDVALRMGVASRRKGGQRRRECFC